MYEYLHDNDFLYKLDSMKIQTSYVRITILDFVSEKPIRAIEGIATSGSITVNGSSSVRRTINLTIQADEATSDLTNVENLISIRTKLRVERGIKKTFRDYAEYGNIGDIIWFPCGVFVVATAQFSRSSSGCTISITGRDKMVLLNGSMGGTLPASTTFTEIYTYDKDNNVTVTEPTIV